MAAPGGAKIRPGGVLRAAGRLVLLVGLGFGAGVLIGVVSEEPRLLVGHLRGEGESVSLAIVQPESEIEEGGARPGDSEHRLESLEDHSESQIEGSEARRLALQRETGEAEAASLPRVAAAAQSLLVPI